MSAEREISLMTGRSIASALRELGHEVVEVDVGVDLPLVLAREKPDVAFMAIHGRGGEDGTIQGMLEIMRIPYTGCGVFASAATMDKVATKRLLSAHGIPVAEDVVVERGATSEDPVAMVESELRYPVMVKPACEGSSIGVTEARDAASLAAAVDAVFGMDDRALVERFIDGRLLTVGIIGNGPIVLPVLEIKTREGFYDYRAKYEPGHTEYVVPAELDDRVAKSAMEMALQSFEALRCEGVSRIDLMLEEATGKLMVLEINTIPGMTATSLLPKAAAAVGIGFNEVVEMILDEARLKVDLTG
jgi:D-alanine-D-alanine ligase